VAKKTGLKKSGLTEARTLQILFEKKKRKIRKYCSGARHFVFCDGRQFTDDHNMTG